MSAWPDVQLQEVASIDRNGVLPSDIKDGTLYVGLEHIESGGSFLNIKPVSNGDLASNKFQFTAKHVLYGKLRPYLAKIAMPDFSGVCSTDILPILPGSNLDRAYLTYFLRQPSMIAYATSRSEGANLPRLSPKTLAEFEIPLPPLDEQRRIAAILDQADALRRARRRAIEQLNDLGQAIFYEMFDGFMSIEYPDQVSLSDFLDFANGINFSGEQKSDEGTLVLDVLNMYSDTIYPELSSIYRVKGVKNIESRYLSKGDILFVRSSLKEEGVGWPALFDSHTEPVAFCGFIIRGRPIKGTKEINPYFLLHYLRLPYVRKKMISSSGKVAITNINQARLGEIQVPCPPLELQVEFSRRVREIETIMKNHRQQLIVMNTLFSSLQHRAFRGEL